MTVCFIELVPLTLSVSSMQQGARRRAQLLSSAGDAALVITASMRAIIHDLVVPICVDERNNTLRASFRKFRDLAHLLDHHY